MIAITDLLVILALIGLFITILWSDRRQDKRQNALESSLADMQSDLVKVQVDVAGLKVAIAENSERLDRMDARFDQQDRRFDERFDQQDRRFDERFDRQDQRFDRHFNEMQQSIRVVSSKVDRAQGNLDVLVFGDRGVPEPVARERAALETPAEEVIAD